MPTIGTFKGIQFRIHQEKVMRHNLEHIHARYGNESAQIGLDGEMINGNLKPQQQRDAKEWTLKHRDEILQAWNDLLDGKMPTRID